MVGGESPEVIDYRDQFISRHELDNTRQPRDWQAWRAL